MPKDSNIAMYCFAKVGPGTDGGAPADHGVRETGPGDGVAPDFDGASPGTDQAMGVADDGCSCDLGGQRDRLAGALLPLGLLLLVLLRARAVRRRAWRQADHGPG